MHMGVLKKTFIIGIPIIQPEILKGGDIDKGNTTFKNLQNENIFNNLPGYINILYMYIFLLVALYSNLNPVPVSL